MASAFATLGDDDVDVGLRMLERLGGRTAQRGDLAAGLVDVLDHLHGRRSEGVGDHRDLGVSQRDLDLGGGRRLGPAQQLQGVGVRVGGGHAMVGEDLLSEVEVLLGHHVLEHLGERLGVEVGIHALVFVGNHDVDTVGVIADAFVDPVEFDLKLFGGVSHGAENPIAAGFADGHHDVAAMGERENRKLDTEFVA